MKKINYAFLGALLAIASLPHIVMSKPVTLINSVGESVHLAVEDSETFLDVLNRIQSFYSVFEVDSEEDLGLAQGRNFDRSRLDFEVSSAGITVRSKKPAWRDFSIPVSKSEKKEIAYIVKTLANDNLISLGFSKSSLEKAGDRIEHIHPYRFLITVFTDEELKAGVHAIRHRGGWTWEGFIDGLTGSLKDEAAKGNLLKYTSEFAQKVNIDPSLIHPSLEKGKWVEFVNVLIDKIPREFDPNRYDM